MSKHEFHDYSLFGMKVVDHMPLPLKGGKSQAILELLSAMWEKTPSGKAIEIDCLSVRAAISFRELLRRSHKGLKITTRDQFLYVQKPVERLK